MFNKAKIYVKKVYTEEEEIFKLFIYFICFSFTYTLRLLRMILYSADNWTCDTKDKMMLYEIAI